MKWPGHRFAITLFSSVIVLWLAAMFALMRASALPAEATGAMLVVFNPGVSKDDAFRTIVSAGAKPIRETSFNFIWVVTGDASGLAGSLVANGALGAYRELPISPVIAGCIAVADAKVVSALSL
jgi:hypothetical protein